MTGEGGRSLSDSTLEKLIDRMALRFRSKRHRRKAVAELVAQLEGGKFDTTMDLELARLILKMAKDPERAEAARSVLPDPRELPREPFEAVGGTDVRVPPVKRKRRRWRRPRGELLPPREPEVLDFPGGSIEVEPEPSEDEKWARLRREMGLDRRYAAPEPDPEPRKLRWGTGESYVPGRGDNRVHGPNDH
jgi:hypothetical protein